MTLSGGGAFVRGAVARHGRDVTFVGMPTSASSSAYGLGLLALATLSCSTVQTKTDFDRSANFSAFHTFKLLEGKTMPSESGAPPNTMVGDRIRAEIKTQLMAKGLTPVEENPNLLVGWVAGARTHKEVEHGAVRSGHGTYMGPGYWGGADVWSVEYKRGTLVIDLRRRHPQDGVALDHAGRQGEPRRSGEARGCSVGGTKAFKDFPPKT